MSDEIRGRCGAAADNLGEALDGLAAAELSAVLDGLAAADLGSVSDGGLGSELVALGRLQARLEAERVRRLAEFDARQGWAADGAKSPAMWLARSTTCPVSQARAEVRLARRLRRLPVVADAFGRGELTAAKAGLFARVCDDRRPKRLAALVESQELLVSAARELEHRQVEELLAFWVASVDPEGLEADEGARYERRGCHASRTMDGMVVLDGLFDPESGGIVLSALDAYADRMFREDRPGWVEHPDLVRSPAQRRADALVAICQVALSGLDDDEFDDGDQDDEVGDEACTCEHQDDAHDGDTADELPFDEQHEPAAGDDQCCAADGHDGVPVGSDEHAGHDDGEVADDAEPPPNRAARRFHARHCSRCRAERRAERTAKAKAPRSLSRPAATVVVDLEVLRGQPGVAYLGEGCDQVISGAAARQLCCDAGVSRVVTRGRSEAIDIGRRSRTPTAGQRRALVVRDGGCALCGCHPRFCEAHHIVWWEHDGPTDLVNLVLLCRHCHGLVHKRGWKVHLDPDGGRPVFTSPEGRTYQARAGPRDIGRLVV